VLSKKVENKVNMTLFARPDQGLYKHITNMVMEFRTLRIPKLNFFTIGDKEKEQRIYKNFIEILLISHDFGKINPFFQDKILSFIKKQARKSIFFENTKLSYHSQLGALFAWILLTNYIEEESLEYPNAEEDLQLHNLAITYAIFNHHNTQFLPNTIISSISKVGMDFRYKDVVEIIKRINERYPSTSEYQLRLNINNTESEGELNVDIPYADPLKRFFAKCCLNNIEIILHLGSALDQIREISDEEDVGEIVDEIKYYWRLYKKDNRLFFLILYYYSLLCDLDEWDAKSHINDTFQHDIPFKNKEVSIKDKIVENYKKVKFTADGEVNQDELISLKRMLWKDVNFLLERHKNENLIQICYPTGSGKTLSYFHLAFNLRSKIQKEKGYTPKIIYALPFISLTDQIGKTIKEVLQSEFNTFNTKEYKQSELLIIHHHLVESEWNYFGEEEKEEINFEKAKDFIKLWDSNIVLTTFVSFWDSLLGGRKRNHLRFHKIAGSIIILDEIQGIPIYYWQLISTLIHQMCTFLNCTIIVGSATFPEAISYKYKWNNFQAKTVKIKNNEEKTKVNRYNLIIRKGKISLDSFAKKALDFIVRNEKRSIMFVLNTKESARLLFDYLKEKCQNREILFLSAAVTYQDRLEILNKIGKNSENRILVCTQVVEAGIDISFDIVFRDLAPLDSIVQVAGRCNRNNTTTGEVHIVELTVPESVNITYHGQIYDQIMIEQTKILLYNYESISEKRLREIIDKFYNELTLIGEKKNTKSCVNELMEMRMENLSKEFQLIKEREDETLIVCKNEEELIDLTIAIDSEKLSSALKKYRQKSIAVSKKIRERLQKKLEKGLQPIYSGKKLRIWGLSLQGNEWVYQENGGLNIPNITGKKAIEQYLKEKNK